MVSENKKTASIQEVIVSKINSLLTFNGIKRREGGERLRQKSNVPYPNRLT